MFCVVAQTGKGGKVVIFSEPAGDGAGMDGEAKAPSDVFRCRADGMSLIEAAEGFQDYLERIGAALACTARAEGDGAMVAVPALEDFVLLIALASPGDSGTGAIDAALQGGACCGSAGR